MRVPDARSPPEWSKSTFDQAGTPRTRGAWHVAHLQRGGSAPAPEPLPGPANLRYTHATLALQAGIHPKVVSERLGHATVSITLDTYSHAIPAMQEEAAALIAGLVFAG